MCFGRERFEEPDRLSSQSLPIGFDTMKNTSLSFPLGNAKGNGARGKAPNTAVVVRPPRGYRGRGVAPPNRLLSLAIISKSLFYIRYYEIGVYFPPIQSFLVYQLLK